MNTEDVASKFRACRQAGRRRRQARGRVAVVQRAQPGFVEFGGQGGESTLRVGAGTAGDDAQRQREPAAIGDKVVHGRGFDGWTGNGLDVVGQVIAPVPGLCRNRAESPRLPVRRMTGYRNLLSRQQMRETEDADGVMPGSTVTQPRSQHRCRVLARHGRSSFEVEQLLQQRHKLGRAGSGQMLEGSRMPAQDHPDDRCREQLRT